MYIIDAILAINPNAKVTVSGKNIDSCEIEWLENTSQISKEDIKSKMQELENLVTQKQNDKISAQNKLKALGLTDAEIEAL
tara:strand:- start:256 stop:498 length:243 start_codon:yes stop_codon:yes gene_type:complete